jgi:hypothetical protein
MLLSIFYCTAKPKWVGTPSHGQIGLELQAMATSLAHNEHIFMKNKPLPDILHPQTPYPHPLYHHSWRFNAMERREIKSRFCPAEALAAETWKLKKM